LTIPALEAAASQTMCPAQLLLFAIDVSFLQRVSEEELDGADYDASNVVTQRVTSPRSVVDLPGDENRVAGTGNQRLPPNSSRVRSASGSARSSDSR
jgi:hypothetical protein